MMIRDLLRVRRLFALPAVACLAIVGCGSQRGSVPSGVDVTLPDGTTVTATMGSGVISLANTTWDFYRTAENAQGGAFVTISFGPEGNLEAFEDSTIAAEIFGSTILFDGARHSTTQSGLQYAAATYGAESADSTGFAFEGRLTAFFSGFEAVNVTASVTAAFDANDPDIVRGTFSFSSRVVLFPEMFPEGNQDDEFPIIGRKAADE